MYESTGLKLEGGDPIFEVIDVFKELCLIGDPKTGEMSLGGIKDIEELVEIVQIKDFTYKDLDDYFYDNNMRKRIETPDNRDHDNGEEEVK